MSDGSTLPVLRMLDGVVEVWRDQGSTSCRTLARAKPTASASLPPVLVHFIELQGKLYHRLVMLEQQRRSILSENCTATADKVCS